MEQLFFGDLIAVDTLLSSKQLSNTSEKRIAIVVSANVVNEYAQAVIVCPLIHTPRFQHSRIGATFVPREISGLAEHTTVNYFEITTIAKDTIGKRIGALPHVFLNEIKDSLKAIFDIG
ncbi:MAG: type II toxin-antitoxin system PemK/MazF family toxin [bacterium]